MTSCQSSTTTHAAEGNTPSVHLASLDAVWFQVGGTICNLRCSHCFISCSPENDKFGFMSLDACAKYLDEAKALGTKEFYFTGGEPFANPQICEILELALRQGPTTVLTNATLFRPGTIERLSRMNTSADHRLEIRVSIDGHSAEMNDPLRGVGTFEKAMDGTRQLAQHGFRPIITITRTWDGCDDEVLKGFRESLIAIGYKEPRLKVLPSLKIGAEVERTSGYGSGERVTHDMMAGYDSSELLCSHSRLVTDQGVWVCPILLDAPGARMGDTLTDSLRDYPLRHGACHTCWRFGAICSNETSCCQTKDEAKG